MFPLKDDIPTRHRPMATVFLILANVAVFVWQSVGFTSFEASVYALGVIPDDIVGDAGAGQHGAFLPPGLTIFTSMFSHGGLLHIGGNMLFLWIFGNNVEDDMGPLRFLIFYLFCGFVAAGAQIAMEPDSPLPMVGASGAIAGVLGAYLLLYPHARVLTLVPIFFFIRLIWIPALFFLLIWFAFQLLGSFFAPGGQGGVAFWAHSAGFLAGLILVRPFAGKIWERDPLGRLRRVERKRRRRTPLSHQGLL